MVTSLKLLFLISQFMKNNNLRKLRTFCIILQKITILSSVHTYCIKIAYPTRRFIKILIQYFVIPIYTILLILIILF